MSHISGPMGRQPARPVVREVAADEINAINVMCVMPGAEPAEALREAAAVHRRVAAMGVRTFGAFAGERPVGRIEVMPIEAAPLPLEEEDLWVIRCLWVLDEATRQGLARALMERALAAATGSNGVAVLTYPRWMPVGLFEHFGFEVVERRGPAPLLLKRLSPDASVSLAAASSSLPFSQAPRSATPAVSASNLPAACVVSGASNAPAAPSHAVSVEAVVTGRCPWMLQMCRRRLTAARTLSPRVATAERYILNRTDAVAMGEENIYIDGVPLADLAMPTESFLQLVRQRLGAGG